jgi:AhpD family alkylhydroperoxidase
MTHITPKQRKELPELEPMFEMVEASMGFLPTSMLTMSHWPELTQAFGGLGATILGGGELDAGLKQMIAFVVSNAAGCRYCQAHTANSAQENDVSAEKIQAVFEF